jgi:signal transduction histidine kinase
MGSSSPVSGEDDRATKGTRTKTVPATSQDELRKAIVLVQHQLNNPLAALLAEAQLLGMEPTLGAEQRAAALRITELTRRVIALVRGLDVAVGSTRESPMNEPPPQAQGATDDR